MHGFGRGVFPDVALVESGAGVLIYRAGNPQSPGYIVVMGWHGISADQFIGLHVFDRWPVPGESPAFPKAYYLDGLAWFAYHDGTRGHLWCPAIDRHVVLDPCQNNEPICFGAGFVAWQGAASAGWPILRMDLRSGETVAAGHGQGTGLAYIAEDGRVVLVDENRMSVPGLVNPVFAGVLTVGEDPDPNNRDNLSALWSYQQHVGRLWATEPCLTPRCAAAGDLLAVTTWGQGADVRLFVGTLDDLIAASAPSPVSNDPKPVPEPDLHPIPEPDMLDPASLLPTLERIAARYPFPPRREDRGAILNEVAWLHRAEGWGLSAKPNGNNVTQPRTDIKIAFDILQHKPSDTLWDTFTDTGLTWGEAHPHGDPTGRPWVAPVAPNGGVSEPTPSDTHAYDGGGNDTGECDIIISGSPCMQPRDAAVHRVRPDTPDTPDPSQPTRPELRPILTLITALERSVRALPAPVVPAPHVCPPCPPCELPHGGGATLPVDSEPALQELVEEWSRAFAGTTRRIMPPSLTAFLLYRFVWEGHTHDQLLAEAAERGA